VPPSPRRHHFWDCEIAQAVRHELVSTAHLAALCRDRLWLVDCPPGVRQPVWDIVCLAALSAMERGRQYAKARRLLALPPAVTAAAVAAAVADFWGRLADFVALGKAPRGWTDVPVDHPFMGRTAAGFMVLNRA
jgi:hypothetical protein